jgi:hypothetical protein
MIQLSKIRGRNQKPQLQASRYSWVSSFGLFSEGSGSADIGDGRVLPWDWWLWAEDSGVVATWNPYEKLSITLQTWLKQIPHTGCPAALLCTKNLWNQSFTIPDPLDLATTTRPEWLPWLKCQQQQLSHSFLDRSGQIYLPDSNPLLSSVMLVSKYPITWNIQNVFISANVHTRFQHSLLHQSY